MTKDERDLDSYLSWLWAVAALREEHAKNKNLANEPAMDNWLKWCGRNVDN